MLCLLLSLILINSKHRLITFDIKDLYVHIPIAETIDITTTQLLKHNDPETTTKICTILGVILQQNYFIFQEKVYQPNKRIAMGSPISGTIAEVFLQHLEHIHIRPLLEDAYFSTLDTLMTFSSFTIPNQPVMTS